MELCCLAKLSHWKIYIENIFEMTIEKLVDSTGEKEFASVNKVLMNIAKLWHCHTNVLKRSMEYFVRN